MSNNVVNLFPSNPGAVPMFGEPQSAPSYMADTAPQSNYLGTGIAGPGPSAVPATGFASNANARPNGSRIRVVPNEGELRQAMAQDQATLNRAVDLTPPGGATGLLQPGIIANPPVIYPAALGGFHGMDGTAMQWSRFGAIGGAVVALSVIGGFALDGYAVKKFNIPKGYAPVIGAVGGTAIANAVGAMFDGLKPALGVLGGTLLAAAPAVVAMKTGKPMKGKTALAVGGATLALLAVSFYQSRRS